MIRRLDRMELRIRRLAAGLAVFGGLGLITATAITCFSIGLKLLRQLLDNVLGVDYVAENLAFIRPILGEEELVSLAVGFTLFAALPWITVSRGHVAVDILTRHLNRRLNRLLDAAVDLLFLGLAYLILTRQWFLLVRNPRGDAAGFAELILSGEIKTALALTRTAETSQVLGFPLWPGYIAAEFFVLCFFLTALFCAVRSIVAAVSALPINE